MNINGPNLPTEVWSSIFELSCTDNGRTGQSLSLVSRSFYRLSGPYRFQSISLRTIKYICRFLAFLHTLPPHLRRIKYLCIADPGESAFKCYLTLPTSNWGTSASEISHKDQYKDEDLDSDHCSDNVGDSSSSHLSSESDWEDYEGSFMTRTELGELAEELASLASPEDAAVPADYPPPSRLPDRYAAAERYLDDTTLTAVHAILELCSDTLIHLSVRLSQRVSAVPIIDILLPQVYMPLLRELTWIVSPGNYHALTPPRQPPAVLFPSLERLHIGDILTAISGSIVQDTCPKLLYLRRVASYSDIKQALWGQMEMPFYTPNTVTQHLLDFDLDINVPLVAEDIEDAPEELLFDNRIKFVIRRKMDMQSMEDNWQDRIVGGFGGWSWTECTTDLAKLKEAAFSAYRGPWIGLNQLEYPAPQPLEFGLEPISLLSTTGTRSRPNASAQ
ncbi:hypothetical protein BDN72DRAFT_897396 [Pluteus cervinus]|uniref:Uncharacterized protein n=1 Tax=Pluteus cervinus TaxID=181527 RepID=A0ACD3AVJ5_9AGAR|nr:hypothetical protein BDN72DRAFT_897396 [Pluteus cervinus]